MTAEQLEELLEGGDWSQVSWDTLDAMLKTIRKLERRVIAAEKLVDALDAVRGMVTQDVGKQIEAETKLDAALTAYREASK